MLYSSILGMFTEWLKREMPEKWSRNMKFLTGGEKIFF